MSQNSEKKQVVEGNTLFHELPPSTRDRVMNVVQPISIKRGKVLFRRGDTVNGLYAIFSGAMKVTRIEAGDKETLLAMVFAGDLVGEIGLVDRKPRSATVTAFSDCELGMLALRDFERLALENADIYRYLLVSTCNRLRETNETVRARSFSMCYRLAQILLKLVDTFGVELPDGRILIHQKITQAELGRMAGFSREIVNRQLSKWRNAQLLSKISGYYCMADMPSWQKFCGQQ